MDACMFYNYGDKLESDCKDCEIGYECPGGTNKKECQAGSYTIETSQEICKDCLTGTYSNGSLYPCTICEVGYYCPGKTDKIACPIGKYELGECNGKNGILA